MRGQQMTQAEQINAVLYALTALGTLLLAVLAIWGDCIRSRLTGPRLKLVLQNCRGSLFRTNTDAARMFYHLSVVNERPAAVATNCQVRLKQLWRRMPNGQFAESRVSYPLTLCWPPSEYTPISITVRRDNPVDFGFLEQDKCFTPNARYFPNGFEGMVRADDAVRYGLEVVSDQFVSQKLQVFEVSWNGKWSTDPAELEKYLAIREVIE
jgi:hypothetical protein